jgi:very-short-patch-repair endonuclease
MTYPVIKIPTLIAKVKPQKITSKYSTEENIETRSKSESTLVLKYPRAVKIGLNIGYIFLVAAILIFVAAIAYNSRWLIYSLMSFLSGLVGINVSSLIADDKVSVEASNLDLYSNPTSTKTFTKTEFAPIDWYPILKGNILPYGKMATAQIGVSEAYFESFLQKYFGNLLHPGYEFKIDEEYSYSSDFTIIFPNGLSFIIEVDEPYVGKTASPHHCTDNHKDTNRDLFFLSGNWIVIRFSEFQVCAYPVECCYTIAQTIDRLNHSDDYSIQFKGIRTLPLDRQWTSREAVAMAKKEYRRSYLSKYNIYHDRGSARKISGKRK